MMVVFFGGQIVCVVVLNFVVLVYDEFQMFCYGSLEEVLYDFLVGLVILKLGELVWKGVFEMMRYQVDVVVYYYLYGEEGLVEGVGRGGFGQIVV